MSAKNLPRVVAAKPLEPYEVWLRFSDGCEGVVDFADVVARGGVFAALRDPQEFRKVRVARGFGTIEWPGGVDVCPDVLYAEATGKPLDGMTE